MDRTTSNATSSSYTSGNSFLSPHLKKHKFTHKQRMAEQELQNKVAMSKSSMDKEARQQVFLTLCGAGLIVATFAIVAGTFVWNMMQAREIMSEAGMDIRRRVAVGVIDEVARTLEPVHSSLLHLTEQAKVGEASGSRIWPMTRESMLDHGDEVLSAFWAELQHDLHLRRVASNGSQREHVPFFGLQALLALQEDMRTPATSMDECVHVMTTALFSRLSLDNGVLTVDESGTKTAFSSFTRFDENGTETLHRTLGQFNTKTFSTAASFGWTIGPKNCEAMLPLWGGNPVQGAFSNFTWFGPQFDRWKQLFGNVPLYTPEGKFMGLISASVSVYYSVSPVLLRTIQDNGDLTKGGELALVAESGVLVGESEFVTGLTGGNGHEGYDYITEVPENSTLGQASALVRRRLGGYCPSEHTIIDEEDRLIDVMPFRTEDYGLPPLPERWCVIMSLPRENIYEAMDRDEEVKIWSLCGNAGMAAIAIFLLIVALYLALASDRGLRREKLRADLKQVLSAVREVHTLSSPMVLISASTFLDLDKLLYYESMRDKGLITVLDSLEDVAKFKKTNMILFLSHQWLSFTFPDAEDGVQLSAMKGAIQTVLSDPATKKDVYIWCDFMSIAQRHTRMQQAAITSLPVYASVADKFIIVAPPAIHKDLHYECNLQTYNERGWCRAEMLAKACGSGIDEMYACSDTAGTLKAITAEDLSRLSLNIFEGEFSYQEDVEELVNPALGLYSMVLRGQHLPHMQAIHAHIESEKDKFFPKSYKSTRRGERVELFGKLIPLLEKHIEESRRTNNSRPASR